MNMSICEGSECRRQCLGSILWESVSKRSGWTTTQFVFLRDRDRADLQGMSPAATVDTGLVPWKRMPSVAMDSSTAKRPRARIDHHPEDAQYGGPGHCRTGRSTFEFDDRRFRRILTFPQVGMPHCLKGEALRAINFTPRPLCSHLPTHTQLCSQWTYRTHVVSVWLTPQRLRCSGSPTRWMTPTRQSLSVPTFAVVGHVCGKLQSPSWSTSR